MDLSGLPINIVLRGRPVLVVGGGQIGTRKVRTFLECGALVTVVAPSVTEELSGLVSEGMVQWIQRPFEPSDVERAFLICSATGDPSVEYAVFEAGERAYRFVNAADIPAACSATLMAIYRDGDLVVGVGSNGRSPAVAKRIRDDIANMIQDGGALVAGVGAVRDAIRAEGTSSETVDWDPHIAATRDALQESTKEPS